jgi:maltooligosyltrehalose trehalohydrolase
VTYTQNHDQIGNRAAGDRLTATLSADRLAVAAVLALTAPGTPMLFMGEEWGASTPWQFFTSHPEAELAKATAEGRIAEFERMGWDRSLVPDPQDPATFQRSHLNWEDREEGAHARLLDLHRRHLALRRERPELTDPDATRIEAALVHDAGLPRARAFRIDRGPVSVLVNLTGEPIAFGVRAGDAVLLSTASVDLEGERIVLQPDAAAVVGPEQGPQPASPRAPRTSSA